MKLLFCINKDNRKNEDNNSAPFRAASVSEELLAEYDEVTDLVAEEYSEKENALDDERRRKRMGRMMTLLEVVSLLYFSTILFDSGSLRQYFALTVILIGYNIFFIGRLLYKRLKKKNAPPSEDTAEEKSGEEPLDDFLSDPRVKAVEDKIHASLGVKADARAVDVLCFEYVTKDGELIPKDTCFTSVEIKMYADGDRLCLVDLEARYELPVSSFRSVKTVRGEFLLDAWNKATPCDEGEYRLYGMEQNKDGEVSFSLYHVLTLQRDGEEYGLCIPAYELPVLRDLVPLPE